MYLLKKLVSERVWKLHKFLHLGMPRLVSNATYFTSKVCRLLLGAYYNAQVDTIFSAQNHRVNRNPKRMLTALTKRQSGWDNHIAEMSFVIRMTERSNWIYARVFE